MATFQFFSVQKRGGSPTGPDPENRLSDQDSESTGRPVSSGLQVPGDLILFILYIYIYILFALTLYPVEHLQISSYLI
jgi:hypothetical protein